MAVGLPTPVEGVVGLISFTKKAPDGRLQVPAFFVMITSELVQGCAFW